MSGVNSTTSSLPSTPVPASSAPTTSVTPPAPAAHDGSPVARPPTRPAHRVLRVPRALLHLSRPYQWAKNPVVIALPAVILHRGTAQTALAVLWATALFTLASIAVYVLNDILDRERDRLNPSKNHRPLASGELSPGAAWTYLAAVCAALAAGVALASLDRAWPVLVYLALNLAYSYRLKHISLVDAFVVAVGFVLRAVQGYLALGAEPSSWLLLTVLTGCLLLALGKRRRELLDVGGEHRPALTGYSVQFIDYLTLISATLSAVTLGIHLTAAPDESPEATALVFLTLGTSVFAVFRYLQLLLVGGGGADPVRTLFRDRLMVGCGIVWTGVFTLLS